MAELRAEPLLRHCSWYVACECLFESRFPLTVPLHRFVRAIVTATLDVRACDAARVMRDKGVGCLVVTRDDHPIGILTDRDLAIRIVAQGRDPAKTLVADIVTFDPIVLSTTDGIETAVQAMKKHGVRRLPIVDATGRLAGLVTADDLTMLLGRELAAIGSSIEGASDSGDRR